MTQKKAYCVCISSGFQVKGAWANQPRVEGQCVWAVRDPSWDILLLCYSYYVALIFLAEMAFQMTSIFPPSERKKKQKRRKHPLKIFPENHKWHFYLHLDGQTIVTCSYTTTVEVRKFLNYECNVAHTEGYQLSGIKYWRTNIICCHKMLVFKTLFVAFNIVVAKSSPLPISYLISNVFTLLFFFYILSFF